MKYSEFINKIVYTEPEQWLYDDEIGLYVFKNDINITIKQDREYSKEFHEDWINNFIHHPTATKNRNYLCFNGNIIDTFYTVCVDEARMYIPIPKLQKDITNQQYRIGKIINIPNCNVIDRYDEYLNIAGIKVLENKTNLDYSN